MGTSYSIVHSNIDMYVVRYVPSKLLVLCDGGVLTLMQQRPQVPNDTLPN